MNCRALVCALATIEFLITRFCTLSVYHLTAAVDSEVARFEYRLRTYSQLTLLMNLDIFCVQGHLLIWNSLCHFIKCQSFNDFDF